MSAFEKELSLIRRGVVEIISEDELTNKLASHKKLIIKAGFDPTASDLHLGHTVVMNKMKQFQDLGHQVIFLIGDFTATIGDPTGKNVMRKPLSPEEVIKNAQTYTEQAFKILSPEKTSVRFNSEWLSKKTGLDLINMASLHTVARMLERDDFSKRYQANIPIALSEFLYPLIQGYDSIYLKADIELGGTDQTFNFLVARNMQKNAGQKPQIAITTPLLEGLDGINKMSKSLNNYIGIQEKPESMFNKIMSISDCLMWRYFELISFSSISQIEQWKKEISEGKSSLDTKLHLAREIVTRFHHLSDAKQSEKNYFASNHTTHNECSSVITKGNCRINYRATLS